MPKGRIFRELNLTHTRGDMYRALIEGIAYGTRHVTDTFAGLGQAPTRLLAVGGGTKRTRFGYRQRPTSSGSIRWLCDKTAGASYGDDVSGRRWTIGAGANARISANGNPAVRTVPPQLANPVYDKSYKLFRRLYEQTKDIAGRTEVTSYGLFDCPGGHTP